MSRLLGLLLVRKDGWGNIALTFHPSHDMGSMFCRSCGVYGSEREARRPCRTPRQTGIGL